MDVRIFQELLGFRVVFSFDFLVVEKVFLCAGVVVELEAVAVERVVQLVPAHVVDGYRDGYAGSVVAAWDAYVGWGEVRAIGKFSEEVERGVGVVRAGGGGGSGFGGDGRSVSSGGSLDCCGGHCILSS